MSSRMQKITALVLLMMSGISQAQISLYAVRIEAADPEAVATFYKSAFGLIEAERIQLPNGVEIMLNYGATTAAALANTAPQVVIMQRESDAVSDATTHVIFGVENAVAVAAAVEAAGGSIDRAPFAYGTDGMMIGMVKDPAGNHIELIQKGK